MVAKVENMKGVMDTKWDPRTRELTVIYDGKVTSARNIKHINRKAPACNVAGRGFDLSDISLYVGSGDGRKAK